MIISMTKSTGSKILYLICVVGVTFFLFHKPIPEYEFSEITNLFEGNASKNFGGVLLVNLDEDDQKEIFVSVKADKNIFYKFKNGKFVKLEIPELEDLSHNTFSATACDLNQDGRDELLLINSGSKNSRIVSFHKSKWIDLLNESDILILEQLSSAYSATCVDRKGDGKFGLVVASVSGPILYLEKIDSKIKDIAADIGLGYSSQSRSISGVPSFLGYTNIFVGNTNKANFYFVNDGHGIFVERAKELGISDEKFESRGMSLIDLNNDDVIDVAYGNHLGPLKLLKQSRLGNFVDVTPEELAGHNSVNAAVVGDFNLDGSDDLYLNNVGNKNELFSRVKQSWIKIDLGKNSEEGLFGVSTLVSDLDNNGSYEMLNTHENSPFKVYTFKPQGPWIKFKLRLPNGGIPRGSILRLRTNLGEHIRSISSGSGRFANYDDILLLGLKKNESVLSAKVTLPSGQKIIVENKFRMSQINTIQL